MGFWGPGGTYWASFTKYKPPHLIVKWREVSANTGHGDKNEPRHVYKSVASPQREAAVYFKKPFVYTLI